MPPKNKVENLVLSTQVVLILERFSFTFTFSGGINKNPMTGVYLASAHRR